MIKETLHCDFCKFSISDNELNDCVVVFASGSKKSLTTRKETKAIHSDIAICYRCISQVHQILQTCMHVDKIQQ